MAFLHARHAGWAGNFGLSFGAVAGFTAILFTWYGVSFLIPSGMHSYGTGAGGVWPMAAAAAAQLSFLAAAGVRYLTETAGA